MRVLVLALVLVSCAADRDLLCGGPTTIANNDPGLALFREGSLQDRKVALAVERINSCDFEPEGETK